MQDIYSNRWTNIQASADNKQAVIKVEGIIGIPQSWLSDSRRQDDVMSTKQEMQNEIKRLKNLKVNSIELRINSYGGDVNHGISMYEALLESGAEISCKIYGHTASIATVIAMAAPLEKRTASANAMGLIHEGRGGVGGTHAEILAYANWLQKINGQIADIYEKSTGLTKDEAIELMGRVNGEGEWLTAKELKEKKIISDTFEPMTAVASYADEINNCGWLPALPAGSASQVNIDDVNTVVEKATNSFFEKIKNYLPVQKNNSNNNTSIKMEATKYAALFAALGVTAMENSKDGVYITMEQAGKLEHALQNAAAGAKQAKAAMETAQAERTIIMNGINEIGATVKDATTPDAKVTAIKAIIAAKPGSSPTGNNGSDSDDPSADGVDWDAINALPHNLGADQIV